MDSNLETPSRALAIAAHPDDVEFGCGGTLAKWAASGCKITHLVCTDGAKGTWDPSTDPAELVVRRREEQIAASRALGGTGEVVFLGWPDGELESGIRQRWEVAAWIRRLQPDVVLGHDPWKRYRLHPDHRNAGFLVTDGIVAARDPLFFPELDAPPHRPSALLLWEADEVNHLEDVTGFVEPKLAALLEHRSQLRSTMGISGVDSRRGGGGQPGDAPGDAPEGAPGPGKDEKDDEVTAFRRRVTDRLAENGSEHGFGAAEAFHKISPL